MLSRKRFHSVFGLINHPVQYRAFIPQPGGFDQRTTLDLRPRDIPAPKLPYEIHDIVISSYCHGSFVYLHSGKKYCAMILQVGLSEVYLPIHPACVLDALDGIDAKDSVNRNGCSTSIYSMLVWAQPLYQSWTESMKKSVIISKNQTRRIWPIFFPNLLFLISNTKRGSIAQFIYILLEIEAQLCVICYSLSFWDDGFWWVNKRVGMDI